MILTLMLRKLQSLVVLSSSIYQRANSKVRILNPITFIETDFLETLYKLTRDHDSLVVINAIEAINEIRANKGGIEV